MSSGARDADDQAADSIGIVVACLGPTGAVICLPTAHASCRRPAGGRRTVKAYKEFGADRVIAERNFGGAMVEAVIVIRAADLSVSFAEVVASRGKVVRAELRLEHAGAEP